MALLLFRSYLNQFKNTSRFQLLIKIDRIATSRTKSTSTLSSSASLKSCLVSLSSSNRLTINPATLRSLHTSSISQDIFNVQDEKDFKEKVVQNQKPVVVEFHATWCGPCKILMPRMETSMISFKDNVDMAKIDIDELPDLAMEYNVGAVPSVFVMKKGKIVDKFVGLKDPDQIDAFIANAAK